MYFTLKKVWLIFFAWTSFVWADGFRYVDVNIVEAHRALENIASKEYKKLSTEAEQVEWVKARLAWVALERLRGREEEALKIFSGCSTYCGQHAEEKEWHALLEWGCKKRGANFCSSLISGSAVSSPKAKAQKPLR